LFESSPTKRSTLMNSEKYIGLDVHQATIVVAVTVPTRYQSLRNPYAPSDNPKKH
jgi:hypothetical protein